jgi:putative chitinase
MTPRQFVTATGAPERWAKPVAEAMARYGIDTPLRKAHFLAQIGHESGGFVYTVENLNYSAAALLKTWPSRFTPATAEQMARKPEQIANHVYGGRMGNTQPGDGWKYRGRGLIQLTGRSNYKAAGFEHNPELLEQPEGAAMSAGWFWSTNGLNALADRDDVLAVTKRINGGTHGLDDRRKRLQRAKAALNV